MRISRRDFMKTGAGIVGLAALPCGISGCPGSRNVILGECPSFHPPPNYFEAQFGIEPQMLREVLTAGLSSGAEYCELFFEHSQSNNIGLEDGEVNRAYVRVNLGVGVRVVTGEQTGYAYTEDLSLESMTRAAKTAATIAKGSPSYAPLTFEVASLTNHYPIEEVWSEVGIERKIPLLERLNSTIFSLDPRVVRVNVSFSDSQRVIMVVRSDGILREDSQPTTVLSATCVAEQDGRRERNYRSLAARDDISFYTEERLGGLAADVVEMTTRLFDAIQPKGGEMPVVLAPASSGILLHEAIGHGMEADFNRKGISIYSDMIGRQVAQDFITIVDDGTVTHSRGSINIDDEGEEQHGPTVLIENGILRSFMHDRISARQYNVDLTGNGRRESFRHVPMPRMRTTYMLDGPHTHEEILRSVKRGIFCETFTNGQVTIGAGDFSFYVSSGSLIEDGRLTQPIKDINLIGNGPKVLQKISMAANDSRLDTLGWTCGKYGQSVPVSLGLPTVLVPSSITVGGVSG